METLKLWFICIIGYFVFTNCTHTPPALDSHTTEVDLLMECSDSIRCNPQYVLKTLKSAQSGCTDSVTMYKLILAISHCYYHLNQIDSSLFLNRKVIDYCLSVPRTHDLSILQAQAYNIQGVIWQETSHRDSAQICFLQAYEILNREQTPDQLPNICINLADCYQQDGNYPQAGFYYRKALLLADSMQQGDIFHYAIYSGMAKLYQELENHTLADHYFKSAEAYWEKGSDYERFFFANSRGNYYYTTKEYPQAIHWFQEASRIASSFSPSIYQGIAEGNLGEVYILCHQADSARYYLDRSKAFFGQAYEQPAFKFYLEGLYASLALLENNVMVAEYLLQQPYDTLLINPQYIYLHNRRLQQLYEQKKDYKNAYLYRIQADLYNDSLRNIKIQNNLAEIEFRYRQDTTLLKKDIELAKMEGKASAWKIITFLSILSFIFLLLLVGGINQIKSRERQLLHNKQKVTITALRMEIVRNRLSPHFLFNVLNAIIPAFGNYKDLETHFRLLIQLLRNSLHASDEICIPLEKEITLVKSYLQLRAISNPVPIQVEWVISPNTSLNTRIPSMCIQIPVENAVKYAFTTDISNPRIQIKISCEAEYMHIIIEDNGVGYKQTAYIPNEQGTGSGLNLLHRTIELLNARNHLSISFKLETLQSVSSSQSGTRITLIIPLNYNYTL